MEQLQKAGGLHTVCPSPAWSVPQALSQPHKVQCEQLSDISFSFKRLLCFCKRAVGHKPPCAPKA